tara:strand:- start:245 stop:436 length:192 start_codon:yes stop_codon:yes gene_type:complete
LAGGGLEARDRLEAQAGEFRDERMAKRPVEYGQAAIGARHLRQVREKEGKGLPMGEAIEEVDN